MVDYNSEIPPFEYNAIVSGVEGPTTVMPELDSLGLPSGRFVNETGKYVNVIYSMQYE